ncbi:hypothetical protein EII14_03285 [Alloprevotella sp. OH1205_COT-284]|uniref:hypothetical protein n=1 Tax=Alloprevotella sp. OH1205_COT-284 TaxID=2491043 RepID=UPI000F5DF464|nr:hypothetical protein [Alloprevotella sp. OH1205_COT-284]RRD80191.1 hypothetical protein EII14_03285 [Alloprevotella sp. OH1205_COT-284]
MSDKSFVVRKTFVGHFSLATPLSENVGRRSPETASFRNDNFASAALSAGCRFGFRHASDETALFGRFLP